VTAFHVGLGIALIAVNAAAGLWGAWCWWRRREGRGFWPLLRIGQGLVMLQAVDGGILLVVGRDLPELHLIYGLMPLGVSFVAEQLRLASAQLVLDARNLEDAQAVGRLPAIDQQSIVLQIVRRELGVMAAAALVTTFLALRALGTV
jgi:hypothetical protein